MKSFRRISIIALAITFASTGLSAFGQPRPPQPRPVTSPVAPPVSPSSTDIPMRQLLKEGFQIKAQTVISEDISRRIGGKDWTDGLMITLQKGTTLAFCHYILSLTLKAAEMLNRPACNLVK